jgi:hypothetical protein
MSWYALENLDEALEKTKDLMLPFDLMTWTKIAIIALLAGGVSLPNLPSVPANPGQGDDVYTPDPDFEGSTPDVASQLGNLGGMTGLATAGTIDALTVGILILALVFIGFFMYITSVFQFIYYQTILDGKPRIIKNFGKHAYRGLRYFGFKIGFLLLVLLSLAIPFGAFAVNTALGFLVLILVWLPILLVVSLFMGLVHDLALLRMMEAEEGLIQAWRSVWPDIKAEWRQVLVYMVVKFFVGIGIGIATFMIFIGVLIFLLIPFGIAGFLASMANSVLLAIVFLVGALTFSVIMLYARAPFSTYLYTYITLFYHDLTS